jgi:phosphoribosylformimino-5-aminoimidazole carboxamide ribotide isomerase
MLLIFPSIEISRQQCIQYVRGEPGGDDKYSQDPVKTAIMWRGENAKTLHITDKDGFLEGKSDLCDIIDAIVRSVDIPIEVGGGIRTREAIADLLKRGVYRVVIGTVAAEQPELVGEFLKEFGSRRIAIAVEEMDNHVIIDGRKRILDIAPVDHVLRLKKMGVSRIIFYSIDSATKQEFFNYDALKKLARKTNLRITGGGGVSNYRELIKMATLEKFGVDSVIIGCPLYENVFPCQRLWRMNERELKDLGPTRRI